MLTKNLFWAKRLSCENYLLAGTRLVLPMAG